MVYENYEYVSYVRELTSKFSDKTRKGIQLIAIEYYKEYQRASKFYISKINIIKIGINL